MALNSARHTFGPREKKGVNQRPLDLGAARKQLGGERREEVGEGRKEGGKNDRERSSFPKAQRLRKNQTLLWARASRPDKEIGGDPHRGDQDGC